LARTPPVSERPVIPRWRKALYSLVLVGGLCAALLGLAHHWALVQVRTLPGPSPTEPSVSAYLDRLRVAAGQPRWAYHDGVLPGAMDRRVLLRVAPSTPGARPYPVVGGAFILREPEDLVGPEPTVLLMGGSVAYGQGVPLERSLGQGLQRALRQEPGFANARVLTLGRPGWELASVAMLLRRLLRRASRPPDAVVLVTGNNEFLFQPMAGLGSRPWETWPLFRAMEAWLARRGWLHHRPGLDPSYHLSPDWNVIPPHVMQIRLWWPTRGIPDAGYLPRVRRLYLDQFRRTLASIRAELGAAGVPLLLVAPPVNLFLFPAGVIPQPATTRPLGRVGYDAVAERLERLLLHPELDGIRAMVKAAPSGPIQWFLLAQTLDEQGHHREAMGCYREARDLQQGVLGAMPTIGRIIADQARPGAQGLATLVPHGWYDPTRSIRLQAHQLFLDSCHPTPLGVAKLLDQTAPALLRLLRHARSPRGASAQRR